MADRTQSVMDPAVQRNQQMIVDLATRIRADVSKVHEPRAQALFETTAEVLDGLAKAYADYNDGTEEAWRR